MDLDPALLAELLETFQGELDDQLQVITTGLIRLEQRPDAAEYQELLRELFRAAHNIKGAARGIEINEVAAVAHQLESVFSELRDAPELATSRTIDVALRALDVMKAAMLAHREGGTVSPSVDDILANLHTDRAEGVETPDDPGAVVGEQDLKDAVLEDEIRSPISAHDPDAAAAEASGSSSRVKTVESEPPLQEAQPRVERDGSGDAIRVRVDKLSRISALAEDLVVTQVGLKEHHKEMLRLVSGLRTLKKRLKPVQAGYDSELDVIVAQAAGLSDDMHQISRRIDFMSNSLQDDARMLRLVPAMSVLQPLVRAGRDVGRQLGKEVEVRIVGGDIEVDKVIIDRIRDPLMHLLRNAIDHGLEDAAVREQAQKPPQGCVVFSVSRIGSQIELRVQDDGRGIDAAELKRVAIARGLLRSEDAAGLSDIEAHEFIFRPGFTVKQEVSDVSGRGVGLDVVRSNIQELNGQVRIESTVGRGTAFVVTLPLKLSTERGLQVEAGDHAYVIPSTSVHRILEVMSRDVLQLEGEQAVLVDEVPVPLCDLCGLLDLERSPVQAGEAHSVVVIERGARSMALLVDRIDGEREIVVKPLRYPLVSVRNVSGATLTRRGQVVMVLSVADLLEQSRVRTCQPDLVVRPEEDVEPPKQHVLVVDDSITTRNLERNILEIHGYEVTAAVNGADAWSLLQQQTFDMVVTDVEMPNMDGFTLTEHIRADARLEDLPVVIVSSLARDEEKSRGLEVGASAYIVKGTFETQRLLDAVQQFI